MHAECKIQSGSIQLGWKQLCWFGYMRALKDSDRQPEKDSQTDALVSFKHTGQDAMDEVQKFGKMIQVKHPGQYHRYPSGQWKVK